MENTNDAPWWDGPSRPGWKEVVRHASDDNQYHIPDQDQLRNMRGSPVGRFAVIPAARQDGRSKGFDPNVAGPVHVDPLAPDGGVIFDPASVTSHEIASAVGMSEYPHQAYYRLGTSAARLGYSRQGWGEAGPPETTRTNPARPGDYVVPKAASDGRQFDDANPVPPPNSRSYEIPMSNPVPPLSSLPPIAAAPVAVAPPQMHQQPQMQPQQAPQPAYYPPQYAPQYAQPLAPPPPDPAMMQFMQQLASGLQALQSEVRQSRQAPVSTGVSPNPMPVGRPLATIPAEARDVRGRQVPVDDAEFNEDSARPIRRRVKPAAEDESEEEQPVSMVRRAAAAKQTVEEYERTQEPTEKRVIAGFETMNIPWVKGPLPDKARVMVYFTMDSGRVSCKFHDVLVGQGCVILVYDTRYEDGQQYLPPDCKDKPILIEVPKLKLTKYVLSMGFTASLGCFDQVILVEANTATEETAEG